MKGESVRVKLQAGGDRDNRTRIKSSDLTFWFRKIYRDYAADKLLLLNFHDLKCHCCESLIEYYDFKRSMAIFIYILIAYHNTHRQSITSAYLHKHTALLRQVKNLISNNFDIILLLGFRYSS